MVRSNFLVYFNNLKADAESKCFAKKTKAYASPSYAPHSNRRTFGSEGENNGGEEYFGLILTQTENEMRKDEIILRFKDTINEGTK